MSKIKKGSVCKGNKLQEFDMTNTDFTKTPVTFRMGNEIIHNPSCHILCRKSQSFCPSCMQQRRTLMVQKCRAQCHNTNRTDPTTTVPYKYLTKEEMKHRMETLHKQLTKVKKQRDRLENKIKTLIAKQSLSLNQNDHNDLKEIVLNECDQVTHQTSLHRIFWEQQVQALKKSDSRAIRWHPLMIKLCILIRHQSQAAYETMRQCIRLPSQRLLRELIRFTCLGDISSQLEALMNSDDSTDSSSNFPLELLSNSMMTFMVRGLFSSLEFPYAFFPSRNIAGHLLFEPFWESINRLERIGFHVLGCTSDGASTNRRFIRLHDSRRQLVHKTQNPFTANRYFFFFSDPPHLLKTTRNCWALPSRTLWKNGKEISWDHLQDIYLKSRAENGLVLLPRLKYEHVHLTSFSKMRVDLAANVLSESVSKALTLFGGDTAQETARFTGLFDKFFDCVNVRNFTDGQRKRKAFQNPYYSESDFRLQWLEDTFLTYLNEWDDSVKSLEVPNDEKKNMKLSAETLSGLRMTTKSFIELVKYLFTVPGVTVFFSRRLCQDPLEKFFGCQRQIGRTHENPTVKEFQRNTQALRVVNSMCRGSISSNCRRNKDLDTAEYDIQPLRRRKRRRIDESLDITFSATNPLNSLGTIADQRHYGGSSNDEATHMCETVIKGFRALVKDDSFYVTLDNECIIKAANAFIQWAVPPYTEYFIIFSQYLISNIKSCFTNKSSRQSEREYICTQYHTLRVSETCHSTWSTFLQLSIKSNPGPALYQYVTQSVLTIFMRQTYGLLTESERPSIFQLNDIEHNALRYFAGYLWKKVISQLVTSKNKHKSTLLLFMNNIIGVDEIDPDDHTEEWTNIIDRGGLVHIPVSIYHLFCQMELQLRNYFNLKTAILEPKTKMKIIKGICEIEDQWQILTEDVET